MRRCRRCGWRRRPSPSPGRGRGRGRKRLGLRSRRSGGRGRRRRTRCSGCGGRGCRRRGRGRRLRGYYGARLRNGGPCDLQLIRDQQPLGDDERPPVLKEPPPLRRDRLRISGVIFEHRLCEGGVLAIEKGVVAHGPVAQAPGRIDGVLGEGKLSHLPRPQEGSGTSAGVCLRLRGPGR